MKPRPSNPRFTSPDDRETPSRRSGMDPIKPLIWGSVKKLFCYSEFQTRAVPCHDALVYARRLMASAAVPMDDSCLASPVSGNNLLQSARGCTRRKMHCHFIPTSAVCRRGHSVPRGQHHSSARCLDLPQSAGSSDVQARIGNRSSLARSEGSTPTSGGTPCFVLFSLLWRRLFSWSPLLALMTHMPAGAAVVACAPEGFTEVACAGPM